MPLASDDVLIVSAAAPDETVIGRDLLFDCFGLPLSATLNIGEKLPDCVGVPEIAPVEALSVKPAGKDPEVIDQA